MKELVYLEQLNRLHTLIKRKATGSAEDCAGRLSISRTSFFRLLNDLKNLGAPIVFNKFRNSYGYEYDWEITLPRAYNFLQNFGYAS